jgi:class 3 adenylate cyclase/tetratricopeptide (TPR) repeat protein
MRTCPACGSESPGDFAFCGECGSALAAPGAPTRELRKIVTVVFSDITGSTALGEQADPESVRRVIGRYFDEMRVALEHHGGTVEKFIGDAVMAVFGMPHLHEDDALRAVRAAVEMRARLAQLNDELELEYGMRLQSRMGIATGEVVAGDSARGDWFVTGDAVNLAERLERKAAPGEIVIAEATYQLARDAVDVEPLETLTVKGKAQPLQAYRLLHVTPGAPAHARRSDSAMVGRVVELGLLQQAFDRAVAERACHLFTVMGAAGVGKSRLLDEFLSRIKSEAVILTGRCLPYGEGITFWPALEAVKLATGLAEGDSAEQARAKIASVLAEGEESPDLVAERVAGLLGLAETPASSGEGFWGVRKLLEALAQRKPLVVVFDDLNWAEPTFLDLVEHVADLSRDAPILLVGMARPELLELRPGWAGGRRNAMAIFLDPLSDTDCDVLIHNLLGQAALEAEVRARIRNAAGGNPLFVEETLSMLIDDGVLVSRNGRWVLAGDPAPIRVPPTIQLLLASRLDQLEAEERMALERAAVEGDTFHRGSVEALTLGEARHSVARCLLALVRKELIRPYRATFAGEDAFRFRHALIHEATYSAVPKETRAELHEACAGWLAEKGAEHDELVGYHLEQAVRHRLELGLLDERGRELAARAGKLLAAAGRKATARGDLPASVALLERAAALPSDGLDRGRTLLDLGRSLFESGDFARADEALRGAGDTATAQEDRTLEARVLLERSQLRFSIEHQASIAEFLQDARRAIATLEELHDDAGLARAWWVVGEMWWVGCEIAAAEDAMFRSIRHSEAAGVQRELARARSYLALAAVEGPMPVDAALQRCLEIRDQASQNQVLEAAAGYALAHAQAMRGRFAEARELAARSTAVYEELGLRFALAAWSVRPASVELLAGDPAAAERILRSGFDTLSSMGEKVNLSLIAASLAKSVYLQGRGEEAEQLTVVSEEATSPEDVWSQVAWRSARATILASRGESAEATRLAREAVELIEGTDALNMRASSLLSLARALVAAGRTKEAEKSAAEAVRLYEAKGNIVSAGKARALLRPEGLKTGAA